MDWKTASLQARKEPPHGRRHGLRSAPSSIERRLPVVALRILANPSLGFVRVSKYLPFHPHRRHGLTNATLSPSLGLEGAESRRAWKRTPRPSRSTISLRSDPQSRLVKRGAPNTSTYSQPCISSLGPDTRRREMADPRPRLPTPGGSRIRPAVHRQLPSPMLAGSPAAFSMRMLILPAGPRTPSTHHHRERQTLQIIYSK